MKALPDGWCGAFVGATMYEAWFWRLWITIDKPRFWYRWNWPISIGWDSEIEFND